MGERGPVGKRSDQRHGHRTEAEKARTTRAADEFEVTVPPARETWHEVARAWYESLAESGQCHFYTNSDWWTAQWCAELMTQALVSDKPASIAAQVRPLMAALLVTEGDRRRVSLELERKPVEEAADVSWIDDARARLRSAD